MCITVVRGICSPLMTNVAEIISKTDLALGKDFQVITISFDQREGTDLAIKKKANYLKLIKKDVDETGWNFYTGDSLNIARATNAVGFRFKKTGNDFLHSATLMMISPDGKATRYLQEPTSCLLSLKYGRGGRLPKEKPDLQSSGFFSSAIHTTRQVSNMY
ncbi:MAG: hypothetical protein IPF68_12485 [Bacteroidales bacterium]|nr:hypothetical protein [Bacteroidales bacterium]